eukprot:31303-Pelagococcus_subviridis.AAC.33
MELSELPARPIPPLPSPLLANEGSYSSPSLTRTVSARCTHSSPRAVATARCVPPFGEYAHDATGSPAEGNCPYEANVGVEFKGVRWRSAFTTPTRSYGDQCNQNAPDDVCAASVSRGSRGRWHTPSSLTASNISACAVISSARLPPAPPPGARASVSLPSERPDARGRVDDGCDSRARRHRWAMHDRAPARCHRADATAATRCSYDADDSEDTDDATRAALDAASASASSRCRARRWDANSLPQPSIARSIFTSASAMRGGGRIASRALASSSAGSSSRRSSSLASGGARATTRAKEDGTSPASVAGFFSSPSPRADGATLSFTSTRGLRDDVRNPKSVPCFPAISPRASLFFTRRPIASTPPARASTPIDRSRGTRQSLRARYAGGRNSKSKMVVGYAWAFSAAVAQSGSDILRKVRTPTRAPSIVVVVAVDA